MRSLVFRFESISTFAAALEDGHGSLPLPDGETVVDGEWVLAIFELGSKRRATAAAARGVRAAGDTHLAFERRDWDRLLQFVAARSEHMRAAASSRVASSGKLPVASESSPSITEITGPHRRPLTEAPPSSAIESARVPFGARILLVDDDVRTRDDVRDMLAEIGLEVEVVETAAAAAARLRDATFDAVVLDFQRGSAQVLDLVRGLRRDPRSAPVPVLLLSDRPSSRDVVDAFASGVDDFLPKPFRAPELGARVFGLLRRARLARFSSMGPGPRMP